MKIIHLKTIDSTHLYALRLVEQLAFSENSTNFMNGGVAIIADEQTNGIGRCKRNWISSKGNLFTSVITKKMPVDLGQLSLTIACAVRETILHYIPKASKNLRLHWPNDVYYQQKKISGILLATSNNFLITSVGINVSSSPSIDNRSFSSICEIMTGTDTVELHPREVLGILLENIDQWTSHLRCVGFSEVRSYWLQNINDINCRVTIKNGDSALSGTFLDINDFGKAVLEHNGERIQISSGDLFINQNEIGYTREE